MRTRVALLMMTVLTILGAAQGGADEARLRVDVSPRVGIAPGFVRVRARITPHEANRALRFSADSGNFYRSSTVQLEGADAQTVEEMQFKNLPGGEYAIAVTLVDANGRQTTIGRSVRVISTMIDRESHR